MALDADSMATLYKREKLGEALLAVETGAPRAELLHPEDRESAFTDAVSDMLTAIIGRAGGVETSDGSYAVKLIEGRVRAARELLDRALRSYEGDAEDYYPEEA